MTNQTQQAVEVARGNADKMRGFLQTQASEIALIAPSTISVDTFIAVSVDALARDELLLQAARNNPVKFVGALMKAARMGLEPGTEEFYLTPRKVKGQWEILGIVGYQGIVKMIYNAGAVSSVVVEVVRERDGFSYSPGRDERPDHVVDWKSDRGDLALVYAYAVMKDGATSKVVVLNKTDIEKHKAKSDSAKSEYSPWNQWPEAMWMKTAARQLGKWVPTSAEVRGSERTITAPPTSVQVGIVDNPDLDDDEGAPAPADEDLTVVNGELVDTETGEVIG